MQKMKAERETHIWEAYANIKFIFNNSPSAEIRIAFYDGDKWKDESSWAYLGTDCLVAPRTEQTVNFGWLDKDTPDYEWRRVVLHEFGHVLGCIHEDQQPAETIQWNKEAVYKWYQGPPNNWTKQDVDENILIPSGEEGISNTTFDERSIMAYPIPPEFTLDKKGVEGGDDLTLLDKQKIGEMYPIGIPVVAPKANMLSINGPSLNGVITPIKASNKFELNIALPDTYRIWTSFIGGKVTVYSANSVVGSGQQQVTLSLRNGPHAVVVEPITHGNTAYYRIHVARIK